MENAGDGMSEQEKNDGGRTGGEGAGDQHAGRELAERERAHRVALRRLFVGGAIAVASTAAMVAVTLPMTAQGEDRGDRTSVSSSGTTRPGTAGSADPADPAAEAGASTAPGVGGAGTTGTGDEALTDQEIERAREIALSGDRSLRTMSEDVNGDDGDPQFLTADLSQSGTGTGGEGADRRRVAELLFYDYRDDRTVKKTVDLTDGRVVRTESGTGVQPPPSGQEAREALDVLLASPVGDGVRQDFRAATGQTLASARKLRVQALTYDTPPASATGGLAECDGTHRCVRLFTRVAGGPWIDTREFVIDLSARKAYRLP